VNCASREFAVVIQVVAGEKMAGLIFASTMDVHSLHLVVVFTLVVLVSWRSCGSGFRPTSSRSLRYACYWYFVAMVLTELISNNAVAVLLTSIAFEIAATVGVDARPFTVAVTFGASASFATPIGYQTNTYVFGAGGYRFMDFPRIGVPLNLIL
jgi:Na+/H+ antiporter NhaD/arsenite permease-like protein